jgi:hypothetical protein
VSAVGDDDAIGTDARAVLAAAIRKRIDDEALQLSADELLRRTHLIHVDEALCDVTVDLLASVFGLHRAVAAIVRAELLRDLANVASAQRDRTLQTAVARTRADLDAIVTRLRAIIDVEGLEEAVSAGVCQPANYVEAPADDRARFLVGVDVLPSHVAAGFDVLRPLEIAEILAGLDDRRHSVIAGPSGSGKSALLWRTARLVERGPRVLRVLRVADSDDVELLIRHVLRHLPTHATPLLVCADNLGRSRMAAWPHARDRLLELPGVLILGAARREDLTPDITASAVVVDARLTDTSAAEIYDALVAEGLPTALEREEAVDRADGLLMEFIALANTGQRLRETLSEQLHRLEQEPDLPIDCLRLVCAAHTLGYAVSAESLATVLAANDNAVGTALARLAQEYLIVIRGDEWQGLHDFRTEVLLELLHEVPPPTLASTYSRAVGLMPLGGQATSARRAAVRLCRSKQLTIAQMQATDRLVELQRALEPVAQALARALKAAASAPTQDAAVHAVGLLEAAERLDSVAYAHAVLPILEAERAPTIDIGSLAHLTYAVAVDGLTFDIDGLEPIRAIARMFPPRREDNATIVGSTLAAAQLVNLAVSCDIERAVRLCEAAEGLVQLDSSDATAIYVRHIPTLPDPPGTGLDLVHADLRAQLTASLASLASLTGSSVASALGSAARRATDATASDAYGARVELVTRPIDALPENSSDLVRRHTYSTDDFLEARAVAFSRPSSDLPVPTAYDLGPDDKSDSVNTQVVLLCRRLFDACPEVDFVHAELWQANRRPVEVLGNVTGLKTIRAGVIRRRREISRSVAFQGALAEVTSAENWTSRLRTQAEIANELIEVLEVLPDRLRSNDSQRGRRSWIERVSTLAGRVADLPGRPVEPVAVLGTAESASLARTASEVDEALRRKDLARSALDLISNALLQAAGSLDDRRALGGAGFRLADATARLDEARTEGAPVFSGIGETLPHRLDPLCQQAARLLTASNVPSLAHVFAQRDGAIMTELLTATALAQAEADADATRAFLGSIGLEADVRVIDDDAPITAWQSKSAVVLVAATDWLEAIEALQAWPENDRRETGIRGRVEVGAVDDMRLFPLALRFYESGRVLPLTDTDLKRLAEKLGLELRRFSVAELVGPIAEVLVETSYAKVRKAERDSTWLPEHSGAVDLTEARRASCQNFRVVLDKDAAHAQLTEREQLELLTSKALLELCDLVESEDGLSNGLASELVDVDVSALAASRGGERSQLFNVAVASALEADRMT